MGEHNQLFLGFDGGQSGSRAILIDGSGHIVESTTGPAFDHIGAIGGAERIRAAFRKCLGVRGIEDAHVRSAFFGLTGLWSNDSPECGRIREILAECFRADLIGFDNDSVSCWAGALGGRPGVVVAAGTGVVSYGSNERGARAKLGGWGHIMGDLGGAYDIGRRALQMAAADEDLGSADSTLKREIVAHFSLPDLRSLQAFLYGREDRVKLIAQCSRIVGTLAEAHDPVCIGILEEAGNDLGQLAVRTAAVLGWSYEDSVVFSLAGGVSGAGPALIESFEKVILCSYPQAVVKKPLLEPVIGAALIACSQVGLDLDCAHRLTTLRKEWEEIR